MFYNFYHLFSINSNLFFNNNSICFLNRFFRDAGLQEFFKTEYVKQSKHNNDNSFHSLIIIKFSKF